MEKKRKRLREALVGRAGRREPEAGAGGVVVVGVLVDQEGEALGRKALGEGEPFLREKEGERARE